MSKTLSWACGAALVLVGVHGCGGSSVQKQRGPSGENAGHAGTTLATGGSSGRGGKSGAGGSVNAGTGGSVNASAGGSVNAGKGGGSSARGARGGRGGSSSGNGGSSGAGFGGAGETGDGELRDGDPIPSNPECSCVANVDDDHEEQFFCARELESVPEFSLAALCEFPDSTFGRAACDDGTFRYSWVEGDENLYELQVERDGTLIAYSAHGYVPHVCGLGYDFDYGRVTAGTPSGECFTAERCNPCVVPESTLPACVPCTGASDYEALSLEDYCRIYDCPANLAEARQRASEHCDQVDFATLSEGCGYSLVQTEVGFAMTGFYFDPNGELIGASISDDVPFGQCFVPTYYGGEPNLHCGIAQNCNLCPDNTGAGGAAGAPNDPGLAACVP